MVYIVIGHYGAGKTNFACNLALKLAKSGKTAIADLDIVNPYFRTADYAGVLEKAGVRVVASAFQTSTLDIPSLTFDLKAEAENNDFLVIDVGGDDEGAKALGRYKRALEEELFEVLYVVNFRRYLTRTAEDAFDVLREIEAASGLSADTLVNNTKLAEETDAAVLAESASECEKLANMMDAAEIITAVPEGVSYSAAHVFPVKIIVNKPWLL
jgi:hypothetical protein